MQANKYLTTISHWFYIILFLASFIRWKQKPKYHHINFKVLLVVLVRVVMVALVRVVVVVQVVLWILLYHELVHKIWNLILNKTELIKYDYGLINLG